MRCTGITFLDLSTLRCGQNAFLKVVLSYVPFHVG